MSCGGLALEMNIHYDSSAMGFGVWRRLAAVAVLTSGRESRTRNIFVTCSMTSSSGPTLLDDHHPNDRTNTCQVDTSSFPYFTIHHFRDPIDSTQDEARRLLQYLKPLADDRFLISIADRQINGRGTKGRKWEGGSQTGNLYLTICIPYEKVPVMPTLLPLQIAVLVAEQTSQTLSECRESGLSTEPDNSNQLETLGTANVRVKWPNDVLINDKKLAGVLIESETVERTTWLLIGIGTNIAFAPSLEHSPGKAVRGATCIKEHCAPGFTKDNENQLPTMAAYEFGVQLSQRIAEWIFDDSAPKQTREKQVVDRWKSFAQFGETYEIRGNVEEEDAGVHEGEKVVSIDIQYDGQLLVRGQDGRNRLLVADYLF